MATSPGPPANESSDSENAVSAMAHGATPGWVVGNDSAIANRPLGVGVAGLPTATL